MSTGYFNIFNSLIDDIQSGNAPFNRGKVYNSYFLYVKEEKLKIFPSKISNIKDRITRQKKQKLYIVKLLSDIIKKSYNEILQLEKSNKEVMRNILEIKIDVCKRFLEDYTSYIDSAYDKKSVLNIANDIEGFNYYPELTDANFNQKIYEKKEFKINENKLVDSEIIENRLKKGFRRSSTQKFIKNYVSQLTPYNGILLYHG